MNNTTEDKKEVLNQSILCLTNMIAACKDIIDGESETTVMKKYNLDKDTFRRFIFNKGLGYQGDIIPETKADKDFFLLSPAEELYRDIIGHTNHIDYPYDLEETIPYVLNTLPEREQIILHHLYWESMTLNEIAQLFNIRSERVRQIKLRALQKLRHPSRRSILSLGIDYVEHHKQQQQMLTNSYRDKEIAKKDQEFQSILNQKNRRDLIILKNEIEKQCQQTDIENAMNLPIEYMGLSVRAYNCLKRSNIQIIGDLEHFTYKDFSQIRNLGRRSIHEICTRLKEYGIYINEAREI